MKKMITLSVLIAFTLIFLGCGDKKKSNNIVGPGDDNTVVLGTLKATLSGAVSLSFNSNSALGHTVNLPTQKEMFVTGEMTVNGILYSLTIVISAYGTGTYNLVLNSGNLALLNVGQGANAITFYNTTGSINFTQVGN